MGEENCCNTEEFVLVHEESFKTLRQAGYKHNSYTHSEFEPYK